MRYGDKVITNTVDITVSIWQVITEFKKKNICMCKFAFIYANESLSDCLVMLKFAYLIKPKI